MKETTPLIQKTTYIRRRFLFIHGLTFAYNLQTDALYFISADGFLVHIATAYGLPEDLKNHIDVLKQHIHEMNYPWQQATIAFFIAGTAVLFIATQLSIPSKIKQLFWGGINEDESCVKKILNVTFSTMSGLWKAVVSFTSLWALLASIPIIGFWPGFSVALLALPGNFFAQVINFLPHNSRLGHCNLLERLRKIVSAYLAAGYALSNMGLYWNTLDQGPMRMGWMVKRLSQLSFLPLGMFYYGAHVPLCLVFGGATFMSYHSRIHNLLSQPGESSAGMSLPQITPPNSTISYSIHDRLTTTGTLAAFYKVIVTIFAFLGIMAFVLDFKTIGWPQALIFLLTALLQVGNFPAQLTFYSRTDQELREKNIQPGHNWAKLFRCFNTNRLKSILSINSSEKKTCCLPC